MDLNRLRTLAGLEPINEASSYNPEDIAHKLLQRLEPKLRPDQAKSLWGIFSKLAMAKKQAAEQGTPFDDRNFEKLNDQLLHLQDHPEPDTLAFAAHGLEEAEAAHDSDFPKVSLMAKPAANTLVLSTLEFNDDTMEFNKSKQGVDIEQATKVKTPADVMKHVNKRLKELKAAIEQYDEKGYDDKSVKGLAVECLEKIKAHLVAGTDEEFKMAQVYYGTLMSPIFDMFPTQLINFLHSKRDSTAVSDKV